MVKFQEYSQILGDMVLKHYDNGKESKQIYECLAGKVNLRTIYRWISKFKATGNIN
jgi:transposase